MRIRRADCRGHQSGVAAASSALCQRVLVAQLVDGGRGAREHDVEELEPVEEEGGAVGAVREGGAVAGLPQGAGEQQQHVAREVGPAHHGRVHGGGRVVGHVQQGAHDAGHALRSARVAQRGHDAVHRRRVGGDELLRRRARHERVDETLGGRVRHKAVTLLPRRRSDVRVDTLMQMRGKWCRHGAAFGGRAARATGHVLRARS